MIEFLDCIIHYVLYIREVYPPNLFERVTAYSVPTFKCTHPTVCDYVGRILEEMRPLLIKVSITLHTFHLLRVAWTKLRYVHARLHLITPP